MSEQARARTDAQGVGVLIRLVVASPDGTRVLARPSGLALWRLPAIAAAGARESASDWTEADLARAESIVGGPVSPRARVDIDVWQFEATGRVIAGGRTWIPVTDADRFGSDALAVRRWARDPSRGPGGPSADGAAPR